MKTISLKCKCPPRSGSWRKKHKFNVLHAKNWSSLMLGRNKCKRDLIMPEFLWGFFYFGFAISVLVIKSMIWVSSLIPVFPQSPLSLGQYFADPKNFQNTNSLLALTPKLPLEIAVHCLSKWELLGCPHLDCETPLTRRWFVFHYNKPSGWQLCKLRAVPPEGRATFCYLPKVAV